MFSHKDPPLELQGTDARTGDNIGYITFGKTTNFTVQQGLVLVNNSENEKLMVNTEFIVKYI